MGAHSSHHEPLERSTRASSFKRTASSRHSKIKGNRTSPRAMDKLRRSIRSSFRRRKEHISEASKPHIFQSDDMDVRSGTCYFHVKYLGCIEVYESRGMQVCEEALRVLKNTRRRPVKAILHVSGDGLRVVEDETKGLIVDQTIEKVSFCAPDRTHERGFSYICRDGTTRRWMCHSFLALRESGERLSHAVGCAFAVCLERKQKRDKECSVTMKFDLSNSTFTRTGSFRPTTMTEKLQDSNNLNSAPDGKDNGPSTTTTVININNNINTNYDRKDNIPVRKTPKIKTHAIERPHPTVSMLQRQRSYRGLSHLNHASPFKRQLSLRLNDLPSNAERTRSHSLELSFDSRFSNPSHFLMKTPVAPIPELSATHNGENSPNEETTSGISDQVSAMCQQLSHGLSLLSEDEGMTKSKKKDQLQNKPVMTITDELLELQPLPSHRSCSFSNQMSSADSYLPNDVNLLLETSNQNVPPLETSFQVDANTIYSSEKSQLPNVDQWLNEVVKLNSTDADVETYNIPSSRFTPILNVQSNSLNDKEVFNSDNQENTEDPFIIDWASLTVDSKPKNNKNTNPFLSNRPMKNASDTAIKLFEVQM